jgi:hypothetical protein
VRHCGDKLLDAYRGHLARVVYVLDPDQGNEIQANLAQVIGEALWRWVLLLGIQVEREREGLLAVWNYMSSRSDVPEGPEGTDALSAADWTCRLLRVFHQGVWLPAAFDRTKANGNGRCSAGTWRPSGMCLTSPTGSEGFRGSHD